MKKLIHSAVMASFLFNVTVTPVAYAADTRSNTGAATVVKSKDGQQLAIPQLQWEVLIEQQGSQGDRTALGRKGGFDGVSGSSEAQVLTNRSGIDISANQFSNAVKDIPVGAPVVISTYDPLDSRLAVSILKVEKLKTGKTALLQAYFTPDFGASYAAARVFASPDDRRAGRFGIDPFAQFASPLNGVPQDGSSFYNVTTQGAMLITGMAAKYVGASYAMMTHLDTTVKTRSWTHGNKWKKKTTTYVDAWAKPKFYVGAPVGVIPDGGSLVINGCATSGTSCPLYALMNSGLSFHEAVDGSYAATNGVDQAGGGFAYDIRSQGWDRMAHWEQTRSGLTFLSMVVIAGLMATGSGWLLSSPIGLASSVGPVKLGVMQSAAASFIGAGSAAGLSAQMAALAVGSVGAGLFVGVQLVQGNGFNSIYSTKSAMSPMFAERINEDFEPGPAINGLNQFKNDDKVGRTTYNRLRSHYNASLDTKAPTNGTNRANVVINELVDAMSSPDAYMEVDIGRAVKNGRPLDGSLIGTGLLNGSNNPSAGTGQSGSLN